MVRTAYKCVCLSEVHYLFKRAFTDCQSLRPGFIENWRRMAVAIKTGTTNTFMLWSPNVDVELNPNYEQYFPGSDYVDLYGLSM